MRQGPLAPKMRISKYTPLPALLVSAPLYHQISLFLMCFPWCKSNQSTDGTRWAYQSAFSLSSVLLVLPALYLFNSTTKTHLSWWAGERVRTSNDIGPSGTQGEDIKRLTKLSLLPALHVVVCLYHHIPLILMSWGEIWNWYWHRGLWDPRQGYQSAPLYFCFYQPCLYLLTSTTKFHSSRWAMI